LDIAGAEPRSDDFNTERRTILIAGYGR